MGSKFNSGGNAKTKTYIINNSTDEKLVVQYNPTSVPYDRSASYSSIESPGMSYPLTQYAGGLAREFSIELFYYDKPFTGEINRARNFLEKLMPPEKNTKKFTKPPTFTFAHGYFVRTCVLVGLKVEDIWLDDNGRPIHSILTLQARQVSK